MQIIRLIEPTIFRCTTGEHSWLETGGNVKWQIGSRRRSGRRRTGYVERGDEARTYPGTLHRGPSSCVKCSTVEKTTWSRREEERKHRTRKEKKKKKKKKKRREDERVERRSHARRVHDVVFATKPRRSAGVTFILTRSSSLFSPLFSPLFLPSFLSFSLSFFFHHRFEKTIRSILETQRKNV